MLEIIADFNSALYLENKKVESILKTEEDNEKFLNFFQNKKEIKQLDLFVWSIHSMKDILNHFDTLDKLHLTIDFDKDPFHFPEQRLVDYAKHFEKLESLSMKSDRELTPHKNLRFENLSSKIHRFTQMQIRFFDLFHSLPKLEDLYIQLNDYEPKIRNKRTRKFHFKGQYYDENDELMREFDNLWRFHFMRSDFRVEWDQGDYHQCFIHDQIN